MRGHGGRRVLAEYAEADMVMRNIAITMLRQVGFSGGRVAEVFGLTATYVSTLHAAALRDGSAALVRQDGPGRPPKLAGAEWERARAWRAQGSATRRSGGGWAWRAPRSAAAWGPGPARPVTWPRSRTRRASPCSARPGPARQRPAAPEPDPGAAPEAEAGAAPEPGPAPERVRG